LKIAAKITKGPSKVRHASSGRTRIEAAVVDDALPGLHRPDGL